MANASSKPTRIVAESEQTIPDHPVYGIELSRGMKGQYGFELKVSFSPSVEEAVRDMRRLHDLLLVNMPVLKQTGENNG